ncbi:glutaredoxin [Fragilaria crotonensis]|nr:glutaredoxin [Fragilaria crotonensis]
MFSRVNLARSLAGRSVSAYRLPQARVAPSFAFFSSDSHDDFAPKRKAKIDTQDEALAMIADHIRENPVMLYMKGSPSAPMCGFSARVIQTLQEQEVDFASVDVLSYPEIREGVKKFSEWPTIPQLYVKGEFIGGCDIVTSMHESGELSDLLKDFKKSS